MSGEARQLQLQEQLAAAMAEVEMAKQLAAKAASERAIALEELAEMREQTRGSQRERARC